MAVQTSRTLYLGGTTGPVKDMTPAQLDALGHGIPTRCWVAGIAVIVGISGVLDRFLAARSPPPSTPARPWKQANCDRAGMYNRGQGVCSRGPVGVAVDPRCAHHPRSGAIVGARGRGDSLAVHSVGADGDGHLSADLHADRAVLRLHTVTVGAVTRHDLRLAPVITAALSERSLRTVPGDLSAAPQLIEIAIDALDIPKIRRSGRP